MENTGMMQWNQKDGVGFLTFPSFSQYPFVLHAFSTRVGGVSQGEFASMNLSFNRGDPDVNVLENYHRICSAVGFEESLLVASAQDHNTEIRRVGTEQAGIGIYRPKDMQSVDGLCTDTPGVTLVTYYADCVPLFFLDPVHHAVGLAHAGWRGTVKRIGKNMVQKMGVEFGSRPQEIIAAIGPSIGKCCYEVDQPVADQFLALTDLEPRDFVKPGTKGGKYMLDLWECNRRVLAAAGILPQNITVAQICTRCNAQWLFSHRATGGKRGGLAAMIALKKGEKE